MTPRCRSRPRSSLRTPRSSRTRWTTPEALDTFWTQVRLHRPPRRRPRPSWTPYARCAAELRALLTAERDQAVELVNAMLADAQALPQLVRHGDWDWHLHAVSNDAPLATRIAVETAMAMVDVIRVRRDVAARHLRRRRLRRRRPRPVSQPLAPVLQHDVRQPQRGRGVPGEAGEGRRLSRAPCVALLLRADPRRSGDSGWRCHGRRHRFLG